MARRRTVGYVQNEWVCPNCQTRNKVIIRRSIRASHSGYNAGWSAPHPGR